MLTTLSPLPSHPLLHEQHQMIRESGMPAMRVIPGRVLEELGRIPHYSEGHSVDIVNELMRHDQDSSGRPRAVTVFVSHRWSRPGWCEDTDTDYVPGSPDHLEVLSFSPAAPRISPSVSSKRRCERK